MKILVYIKLSRSKNLMHFNRFVTSNILPKRNFQIFKRSDFSWFSIAKTEKKKGKTCLIHIIGFHCVAKNRKV